MRRAIAWLLAGLPFDARSRRAIDETLLDWEGEATEAQTFWEATGAELHGVASILRVTSLSVLRESLDLTWCRGLGRRFRIFGATAAVMGLLLTAMAVSSLGTAAIALGTLIASVLSLWFLPSALFLIVAWRPLARNTPPLGSAMFVGLVTMAAVGWLLPLISDPLNEIIKTRVMALAATDPAFAGPPPRGSAPWPGIDLAGIAGLVTAAIVFAGALVRRKSAIQSRWWLVGVPLMQSVGLALVGFGIGVLFFQLRASQFLPLTRGLAMLSVAAVLIALSFRWRRSPEPDGART
jgi:hypothetical protein